MQHSQIIPHFHKENEETITAYRIKTQFIHWSWCHNHKQVDFSLVCRKSEEDKFIANLALQKQVTYSSFVKAENFISGLEVFCLPLNYLFFFFVFLTIVAYTTKKMQKKSILQNFPNKFLHREVPCSSCPILNTHVR